jgi:hypothetical protein
LTSVIASGQLRKMAVELETATGNISSVSNALYALRIGDARIDLNLLIGKSIALNYLQQITCIECGRKTKTSFSQGYCYPCFQKLAQCDSCIVSPERCHFDQGTCREPDWAQDHCMQDHIVYLANSSGLKVGITRHSQIPVRWLDQGASQALPIVRVKTRHQAGLVEVIFKQHIADKTNWRTMLKGEPGQLDLLAERDNLLRVCAVELTALSDRFGLQAIQPIYIAENVFISYPVTQYPVKVGSLDLEKLQTVGGVLMGIKGQYLIFDSGVINIRKYAGYHVELQLNT